jgi:hypothetical protein
MKGGVHLILACWFIVAGGCSSRRAQEVESSQEQTVGRQSGKVWQKGTLDLVAIDRCVLTEEALTLDYHVHNIYPHDIWVCEDVDAADRLFGVLATVRYNGPPQVDTRITNDILHIGLMGSLEWNVYDAGLIWTRYRRLVPQEKCVQTIRLPLPARNRSRVYRVGRLRAATEPIVLHYVLFHVGFFAEDLPALLAESQDRNWCFLNWEETSRNATTYTPHATTYTPPESKDPNIVFVPWPWGGAYLLEQSAQITITDVSIPAEVETGTSKTMY